MQQEKQAVIEQIQQLDLGITEQEMEEWLEIPPNPEMGDYAFPCFKLAKTMRKAPPVIAKELAEKVKLTDSIDKVEANGPYINFFVKRANRTGTVLEQILEGENSYGTSTMGEGKTIIVEFSSTNIAKPFHIGHIRSTVIGNALRNIYDKLGFHTIAINHLGDYGTQFGMMIAAYKKWGDAQAIENDPIREMLKLYVRYNQEVEKDPAYKEEARYWFKELETGNSEAVQLWKWFKDLSLVEFNRVYDLLGITFDSYNGESFYSDKMDRVIDELTEKDLLEESDGAMIVNLEEYDLPPALIQKSDGSTLYITRDLAAVIYRHETYDFDKNIYVVGAPQILHFKQLFAVLEKMGYECANDCVHIPFGTISMEDGAMATRKGLVIFLEDVLNNAVDKTLKIIEERNADLENKEEVAKQVGIGAVVFQELFNNRIKDYVFTWDRTLNFEGETGPYVQYTHARASSLLRKEKPNKELADLSYIDQEEEAYRLIGALSNYPKAIVEAMEKNEPYIVTRQVLEIAKQFNKFYNTTPILKAEEPAKHAYLLLVQATKEIIRDGLALLGIHAPETM